VNTDHNITGEAALIAEVETAVEQTLGRFGDRITRVEVHLSDENSDKKSGAEDIRCLLEARLVGLQPISLSHRAATVMQAVEGAAEQMERSLDSTLGRLGHH
jgi:hypothetical protein